MKTTKERVCYCDDKDTCNDGVSNGGDGGDGGDNGAGASAIKVCFGLISSILLYSLI